MAKSSVLSFRASVLQFIRFAEEHELPRGVAELDKKIRSAALHGLVFSFGTRPADHPL